MKVKSAEFICSAVKPNQYPPEGVPEIAFAGRSNVGKSSLINLLFNNRKLAKVSSTPGKTRTINFFSINDGQLRIADLPGYGFATVSKAESESWGKMMETYLTGRKDLKKVVQLVDSRHAPSALDKQMYDFLKYYGLDGLVVATKSDKLSKNELSRNIKMIKNELELSESDIIVPVSALAKTGVDELIKQFGVILGE